MTPRRTIFDNAISFSAGQFIALFLGFITHAFWARAIGPEQYGILGFALTIVSYFGLAATLGTDIWGTRGISRNTGEAASTAGEVLSLRLALSVLSLIALVILLSIWRPAPVVILVILIQFAGVFVAAFTLDFAFQGLEQMGSIGKRQIVTAVLALAGISATLLFKPNVVLAATVFQGAALIAAIIMLVDFIRLGGVPKIRFDPAAWRNILGQSAPIAVTGVVATIYFSIDIVMLGFYRPQEEVGLYVAAGKVLMIGMTAATIVRAVFFPVLSRLLDNAPARRKASGHHAEVIIFFGGLFSVGGYLLAPEILEIIFGASYGGADQALRILMANLAIAHLVALYQVQLLAWNMQNQQMKIMIAGALINVLLNFWLIPKFGMEAAAATTLVSSFAVFLLALLVLKRNDFEVHGSLVIKAAVICAAVGIAGHWILAAPSVLPVGTILRFVIAGVLITAVFSAIALAVRLIRPLAAYRYMAASPDAGAGRG
ncbi:MAG: oligosaccharide flippase family protein [Rhodospirillales bacterium]|jgi:O-antigen/teichoic acid export membrane protein|nr:oligosaccharide flippase family protein [Rhodospirillales bacterium]MDP6644518.1 oligosaccharide flippase family protein [Rhodospirillales bacterium]|tara:strand:- start:753 stop:2213 length:1461 start_codon:yes stop_codon:yes gene_type:complete